MSVSNLGYRTVDLVQILHGFLQPLQGSVQIVPYNRPRPLPCNSFPVHPTVRMANKLRANRSKPLSWIKPGACWNNRLELRPEQGGLGGYSPASKRGCEKSDTGTGFPSQNFGIPLLFNISLLLHTHLSSPIFVRRWCSRPISGLSAMRLSLTPSQASLS